MACKLDYRRVVTIDIFGSQNLDAVCPIPIERYGCNNPPEAV